MKPQTIETDVCIIGAGPAGAVLGAKLALAGKRVVILERGPRFKGLATRKELVANRAVHRQPMHYHEALKGDQPAFLASGGGKRPYFYSRVSAAGGTSLAWRAFCQRPLAEELQARTQLDRGRDWPFNYEQLEPWLSAAETELGVAGSDSPYASSRSKPFPLPAHAFSYCDQTLLKPALQRMGWHLHSNPVAIASRPYRGRPACRGCRQCDLCPSGARYSADLSHLAFFQSKGGTLYPHTQALRVAFDPSARRSEHVLAIDRKTGNKLRIYGQSIVIAAGGVESPRLLQLSLPVQATEFSNALGTGFGDSLVTLSTLVLKEETGTSLGFSTSATDHFRIAANRSDHDSFHLTFAAGRYDSEGLLRWVTRHGKYSPKRYQEAARRSVMVVATVELEANGRIGLAQDRRDGNKDPIASIEYAANERGMRTMQAATTAIDELGRTLGAQHIHHGTSHGYYLWGGGPRGACGMGEGGVCDEELRVRGTENLYVLSSAAFPHLGSTSPTLTLVALALRLAERLGASAP